MLFVNFLGLGGKESRDATIFEWHPVKASFVGNSTQLLGESLLLCKKIEQIVQ